jgi:hypothetical protein
VHIFIDGLGLLPSCRQLVHGGYAVRNRPVLAWQADGDGRSLSLGRSGNTWEDSEKQDKESNCQSSVVRRPLQQEEDSCNEQRPTDH